MRFAILRFAICDCIWGFDDLPRVRHRCALRREGRACRDRKREGRACRDRKREGRAPARPETAWGKRTSFGGYVATYGRSQQVRPSRISPQINLQMAKCNRKSQIVNRKSQIPKCNRKSQIVNRKYYHLSTTHYQLPTTHYISILSPCFRGWLVVNY